MTAVGLVLSTALLALRMDGPYYIGKYLWAEDGNVFINQANQLGVGSIFLPYAGYLHVYPRTFAYLSSFFSLAVRCKFYLQAWWIAYWLMLIAIITRVFDLRVNSFVVFIMCISIPLQSNSGEVLFNITNSQWMLAVALCILATKNRLTNFEVLLSLLVLFYRAVCVDNFSNCASKRNIDA